jgi:hypothetical protein
MCFYFLSEGVLGGVWGAQMGLIIPAFAYLMRSLCPVL